jgi:phospholipid/cholesterol/gamma-HCH transport system permease protein
LVAALGRQIIQFLRYFGETTVLQLSTWRGLVTGRLEYGTTIRQLAEIGVNSLPIAAVTLLFSGMVIGYHMAVQAGKLGASTVVGWIVAETMSRELGPVLVAFVVAARAGSAMAAEIGAMKVTEQIDALRAMATDPVHYLVAPRYIACLVMVPLLVFVGDVVGVTGGYLMALITPEINQTMYFNSIPGNLELWTVGAGVVKGAVFGVIIATVGCHQGLTCRMATEEVGHATTRSVVYSIMLVYAANLILTTILYPG